MVTVGISMNTRLLSVAVISKKELLSYSTHLHKSSWNPRKKDEIIASLEPCVRQYSIKSVALSISHVYYQTPAYRELVAAIKKFFASQNIPVYTKTPDTFAVFYTEGQKKTKKGLMEALVILFPELTYCYQKELKNKKRYYFKLFEAVAAATLLELDK